MAQPGHEFHELAPKHESSNVIFDPFIDIEEPVGKDYYHSLSSSLVSSLPRASSLRRDGATSYFNFDLTSNDDDGHDVEYGSELLASLQDDAKGIISIGCPPSSDVDDKL